MPIASLIWSCVGQNVTSKGLAELGWSKKPTAKVGLLFNVIEVPKLAATGPPYTPSVPEAPKVSALAVEPTPKLIRLPVTVCDATAPGPVPVLVAPSCKPRSKLTPDVKKPAVQLNGGMDAFGLPPVNTKTAVVAVNR